MNLMTNDRKEESSSGSCTKKTVDIFLEDNFFLCGGKNGLHIKCCHLTSLAFLDIHAKEREREREDSAEHRAATAAAAVVISYVS